MLRNTKRSRIAHAVGGFHDDGPFWYRFLPLPANDDAIDDEQGDCPTRHHDGAMPVLALVQEGGLWIGPPWQILGEYSEEATHNCDVAFDAEGALHLLKSARLGEKLIVLNGSFFQELLSARRDKGE